VFFALAIMTSDDYQMTMKDRVGVAELKARLSAWLRLVRRGRTLTVMDRDTPVALLTPVSPTGGNLVIRAPRGELAIHEVPLPPPLKLRTDVVQLLLDDRQSER
jgi:antitoxin (DNA-binding transcriptional repressor) of toxin-antitoxin stability system